jgi:hypothetical protein
MRFKFGTGFATMSSMLWRREVGENHALKTGKNKNEKTRITVRDLLHNTTVRPVRPTFKLLPIG